MPMASAAWRAAKSSGFTSSGAALEIGFGDRLLGLHRVHEAEHGIRQRVVDQAHLADGRDVIVSHALAPQDPEEVGGWVGLHGIERAPRELLCEEPGRAPCSVRAEERHRLGRTRHGDFGNRVAERGGS